MKELSLNLVSNNMTINVIVFCSFIKYRIISYMTSNLIVTI